MSRITIRTARSDDFQAIERLARLDSATVPAGEILLAERCGEAVAALSIDTGAKIADPFRPTADVIDLLELHAHPRSTKRTAQHSLRHLLPRAA